MPDSPGVDLKPRDMLLFSKKLSGTLKFGPAAVAAGADLDQLLKNNPRFEIIACELGCLPGTVEPIESIGRVHQVSH